MAIFITLAAAGGLAAAWLMGSFLPNFLLYATPPLKADAVVLLLGPDEDARRRQAEELIALGWAKYLIVPYEGRIVETQVSGSPVTPRKTATIARGIRTDRNRVYVERTHIEMLQTRALMAHIGGTRAIFVSSPYHMRRVNLMARRVFDPEIHEMAYVPTANDPPHTPWFLSWRDIRWVSAEWGKILWFLAYAPFV